MNSTSLGCGNIKSGKQSGGASFVYFLMPKNSLKIVWLKRSFFFCPGPDRRQALYRLALKKKIQIDDFFAQSFGAWVTLRLLCALKKNFFNFFYYSKRVGLLYKFYQNKMNYIIITN